MTKRFLSYVLLSILSLSCLSLSFEPAGSRGIACVDSLEQTSILPLSNDLFGEIQDEALRKSALDYYIFLSKVEMQALAGRQAIFSYYGVKSGAPNSMMPQVQNFGMGANYFASGFLWGQWNSGQIDSLSLGKNPLPLSIPPYSSAPAAARVANAPFSGIGGGTAFPSVNATNHKIGM